MQFELIRYLIVLIGTLLSTFTDIKSGLILDKITYPMIALGVLFTLFDVVVEQSLTQLVVPLGVFAIGYGLYYAGKIGGGDVKIFTAFALLLPFYQNQPFVLNVLLIAVLSSITVISAYFVFGYWRKGINWKECKKDVWKSALLAIAVLLYLLVMFQLGFLSLLHIVVLVVPMLFGLVALAFQKGIYKEFFLKHVSINQIEEDEIIAREFIEPAILHGAGLSIKGVISKKEAKKLVSAGLTKIPVYRSLPPFAPFLLLGVIISFFFPDFFSMIFL